MTQTAGVTSAPTEIERLQLARAQRRTALCPLPPCVPGSEYTCPHCGTVWRPYGSTHPEWVSILTPGGCDHRHVTRYRDEPGVLYCEDTCGSRLTIAAERVGQATTEEDQQ